MSFARPLPIYNAPIALYIGKRALYTAHAENACSLQKGIDSSTKQDTASCQSPATLSKKNPTHGASHGQSMRQTMYYKAHDMLRKARKHKSEGYENILDRWLKDDKYRLCQILGGLRKQIIQYFEIALEDHSYVATWQERNRNGKSWTFSLNAEGIQGPLNQRSDFIEAKQKCKRLHDEHTAITGDGSKPFPPAQQVRQRLDQQFEGLEEYHYRLGPRTRWRFYPSSRTTHSSSSSHWQKSSDWKSNRSWDSWHPSSWTATISNAFGKRRIAQQKRSVVL